MRYEEIIQTQKDKLNTNTAIFALSKDDVLDDSDLSATDLNRSMRLRLHNREVLYLNKMTEALRRLHDGTFGVCECCGEKIEAKRLEARPTTTFCITCKEEEEREERLNAEGRRSKSLGEELVFKLA